VSALRANLPALAVRKPMVLLTGFLGAGKTSFLRGVLDAVKPWHIATDVILNDYENADLDAETLRDRAATVEALAASCACCDGLEPLVDLALAASRSRHDAVLIELNGTADPLPLLESFTLLESRIGLRPRWQVCVVDARHFGRRGRLDSLESRQLQSASHFTIRHDRGLTSVEREALLSRIRAVNPHASETDASALADHLARAVSREQRLLLRPVAVRSRTGLPDFAGHRIAHEFTGCQILLPPQVGRDAMWRFLAALPAGVLRAKALVTVTGEPGVRRLFERVGTELMGDPLPVPISDRVPSSAICIGPDLDPGILLDRARREFGRACKLPDSDRS
jgi:G3E family GTPase